MNKTKKFLIKSIYLLPLGFFLWMLPNGFNTSDIGISIVAGLIIALLIVFWNLFEYEKFNEILYNDFLESQHSVSIKNTEENWNDLKNKLNLQIAKIKKIRESENHIEYQIDQKITDSILRIEKKNDNILVNIKRKHLNFIPDMAENYGILKKLIKEKTTANNVSYEKH
ncbi:hypothetical protein [Aequorivita vladivostokensis]|uniref:Uncharacterized protein n=1 Tax=Aequorivita vladivostokensis TaxID=171194 RepID=A0ABR5DEU1_9FLAO|nr:hypothetical protein [Aequorivita vladivostokensis]KJJ37294.1 hypothetical protein MB09_15100 [Aequorivita vladivostokensis]MBF30172.1 hypothetical protein [Aequorivita sp.]|tara:strand:- start:23498 stop:24004 length:507 start_codon:yes stop_codon:yes gene_type:complete